MYHTSKQALPRCGFCVATGFNIPTNHFMVDTNTGRTICPRLLSTVCKFCSITGHTAKHCSERKIQEREQARIKREAEIAAGVLWMTPTKTITANTTCVVADQDLPITGSRFGIFCEESELSPEEPSVIVQRKATPPSCLKSQSPPKPESPRIAWSMALKIADVPERTSTRDVGDLLATSVKQLSYTRLIEANRRWSCNYPPAKDYEKTRWEEVDLHDDDQELPDVHDMFRAEERARMLRKAHGLIV